MNKHLPPVSIEQLAAYLDGNLTQSEMQQFAELASRNKDLKHILDASDAVEETLSSYSVIDMKLPDEIAKMNFELPTISETLQPLVTLSQEPFQLEHIAAASVDDIGIENNTKESFSSIRDDEDESIGSVSSPDMSETDSSFPNSDDGL